MALAQLVLRIPVRYRKFKTVTESGTRGHHQLLDTGPLERMRFFPLTGNSTTPFCLSLAHTPAGLRTLTTKFMRVNRPAKAMPQSTLGLRTKVPTLSLPMALNAGSFGQAVRKHRSDVEAYKALKN